MSIAIASKPGSRHIEPLRCSPIIPAFGTSAWNDLSAERIRLIDKKYAVGLSESESLELDRLQTVTSTVLDREFPAPRLNPDELTAVRRALEADGKQPR